MDGPVDMPEMEVHVRGEYCEDNNLKAIMVSF